MSSTVRSTQALVPPGGALPLLLLLDLETDKDLGTGSIVPSNGDLVLAGDGVPFPIFTLIGISGVGGSSGFAFGGFGNSTGGLS